MSNWWWIKKMWYIHTMEYYSAVKSDILILPVYDKNINKTWTLKILHWVNKASHKSHILCESIHMKVQNREIYRHGSPSWITALSWKRGLSNSMKLWTMPCRATQDGQVIAESSNKMWSAGGGNGKPPQYSCCKNLTDCIKGQKYMTLKDESHRSEMPNMLLGKSGG